MKKRKGWSAVNVEGIVRPHLTKRTAVAAAASVPSSFTSTKALWTTFDRTKSFAGDMPGSRGERTFKTNTVLDKIGMSIMSYFSPEKSAFVASKASIMPMLFRTSFRSYVASSLNRGSFTSTSVRNILAGRVHSTNFS